MFKSFLTVLIAFTTSQAYALQLDWKGQFWFDQNFISNYQLDRGRPSTDNDANFNNNGSMYVPGNGQKNPIWYAAFLKLNPKAVVNDSIQIKSELHVGSPIYGFYGRGFPTSGTERYNFLGAQKEGMSITAQRFWANLITDFGTVELGRAPIHWGLGTIWNSGDNLFDRYQNTGDMVRLTSKFGNFSIQPAYVKVATGNNLSGASVSGNPSSPSDDITDYDLGLKYDNSEEEFELGMMWTKRIGNEAQRSLYFSNAQTGSTRINLNIFDFYFKKKLGRFRLGGEVPLISGPIGAVDGSNEYDYKTMAFLFEGGYASDLWDIGLKAGHAPGQPSTDSGDRKFKAAFLNKDYRLGLIMFHYNIYGFGSNNPDTVAASSLKSPYDNQIVNATYVALNPQIKLERWTLKTDFIFAWSDEAAKAGNRVYDYNKRAFYNAVRDQDHFMGWETDLGVSYKWDDNTLIAWDFGFWMPGSYYEFTNSNVVDKFKTDMMFASQVKVGISF